MSALLVLESRQHLALPDRIAFKGLCDGDPLNELGARTVGLADGIVEGENADLVHRLLKAR